MQTAPTRTLLPARGVTRTGSRAARVGAFALEVWSRLLVDGLAMSPDERARELAWVAENMCALHGVRISLRGTLPAQPSLLVANHVSYFDPMIIGSLTPCTAVAKREVGSWPMVGDLLRRLGVLYVERECGHSGARVLRTMLRSLEQGISVLVFPEGTTTIGEQVLPFRRGSFGVALHAGVPIVPIAVSYERKSAAWVGDDPFLPHYMRTIATPYTRVTVDVLPQLSLRSADDADELAQKARRAIEQKLRERALAANPGVSRYADVWPLASA